VRRSFHTLKGSGRMVGARDLAEFAWSIENLLNRLLDNTLTRTQPILATLSGAVADVCRSSSTSSKQAWRRYTMRMTILSRANALGSPSGAHCRRRPSAESAPSPPLAEPAAP
jgi:chemosensory pili system protein ChpA (sensor histidine kinase/response regulator)